MWGNWAGWWLVYHHHLLKWASNHLRFAQSESCGHCLWHQSLRNLEPSPITNGWLCQAKSYSPPDHARNIRMGIKHFSVDRTASFNYITWHASASGEFTRHEHWQGNLRSVIHGSKITRRPFSIRIRYQLADLTAVWITRSWESIHGLPLQWCNPL